MFTKRTWVKILVPIMIVLVIGGIWFIKSKPAQQIDATQQTDVPPHSTMAPEANYPSGASEETRRTEKGAGADFALDETSEIDFELLASYQLPVIVDYGSDSCIPCQQMAPVLKTLNDEFAGRAFVKFVDVWKYGSAAANVPIQVIPTQVLFNADGTPFVPSETLAGQIAFTIYSSKESGEHIFTVHQGGLTEPQMRAILKEMGVE